MRHCPRCGTEYEQDTLECMDCHVPLQPGSPLPEPAREAGQDDVKMVVVRTFVGGTASIDAEMAKSVLEAEGIPSFLTGANAARLYHVLDVQLMVREEDAGRATTVLKEYSDAPPAKDVSD